MGRYTDEDGIDGPFERAMTAAMREDARQRTQRQTFGVRTVPGGKSCWCKRCHSFATFAAKNDAMRRWAKRHLGRCAGSAS